MNRDEIREERIVMEAIVDCYNEEERAMGWYYYLGEQIVFPFQANCINKRSISPLNQDELVNVISMAPEDECDNEIFVMINWQEREFSVPLGQLKPVEVESDTLRAIEDWHYWKARGYQF